MGYPSYRQEGRKISPMKANGAALYAFQIALRFGNDIPTYSQLMDEFGMSKPTAYRWLNAIKLAHMRQCVRVINSRSPMCARARRWHGPVSKRGFGVPSIGLGAPEGE